MEKKVHHFFMQTPDGLDMLPPEYAKQVSEAVDGSIVISGQEYAVEKIHTRSGHLIPGESDCGTCDGVGCEPPDQYWDEYQGEYVHESGSTCYHIIKTTLVPVEESEKP